MFKLSTLHSVLFLSSSLIFIDLIRIICTAADDGNLQDFCPADTSFTSYNNSSSSSNKYNPVTLLFINGLPCKNPANVTASDFKNNQLSLDGDTDNLLRSSMNIVTAYEFPGLNTLGLSTARTDIDVDGIIAPHYHPRASEILFVAKGGKVIVGFVDTSNNVFQMVLGEGDVFIVPRGLLHYCFNTGFELATIFSVLNSQNPGVVGITNALFNSDIPINKISNLTRIFAENSV